MKDQAKTKMDVDTSWLPAAVGLIQEADKPALALYCWAKRVEEKMKEVQAALRQRANSEFVQLRDTSSKMTRWPIEDFAVLTHNAAKGTWVYPGDLIEKQAALDEEFERFKRDHKSSYVEGSLNPDTSALFKVSILR